MKNFFLAKFYNVKKKQFEKSFQSNPVNVNDFKVHFFTFAKVFGKYIFSLAFYGMFAMNQMKNLREKSQSFLEFFLIFSTHSELWEKTFSRGVRLTIKVYIGSFLKKSLFNKRNVFLKVSSHFHQKKTSYFWT